MFWKDRNNGDSNAQDHVKADEELVLSAVIRLRVENVEENNKNQGQGIEQACTGQQSWRKKNFYITHVILIVHLKWLTLQDSPSSSPGSLGHKTRLAECIFLMYG